MTLAASLPALFSDEHGPALVAVLLTPPVLAAVLFAAAFLAQHGSRLAALWLMALGSVQPVIRLVALLLVLDATLHAGLVPAHAGHAALLAVLFGLDALALLLVAIWTTVAGTRSLVCTTCTAARPTRSSSTPGERPPTRSASGASCWSCSRSRSSSRRPSAGRMQGCPLLRRVASGSRGQARPCSRSWPTTAGSWRSRVEAALFSLRARMTGAVSSWGRSSRRVHATLRRGRR